MDVNQYQKDVKTYVGTGGIPKAYSKEEFVDKLKILNSDQKQVLIDIIKSELLIDDIQPAISSNSSMTNIINFFKSPSNNSLKARKERANDFYQHPDLKSMINIDSRRYSDLSEERCIERPSCTIL